MRFDTKLTIPKPPVVIQLVRENEFDDDLDLYFDDVLVAFFADGKMWTITFLEDNSAKLELEAKGVEFIKRTKGVGYRIAIEL